MNEITPERCGYALTDSDGEQYPCDRPAVGWRWYQDVGEHEDMLDAACDLHENAGGALIAASHTITPALLAEVERLTAERDELLAVQDQAYGQESDAEADRDHWQARALAAEERVDGQAWEEVTARAERAEAEVAQLMADLIPVDQAWQQGYTDSERDCPACAEVQRLRERIEGLADEYDERSRDTESTERYPWGVAADDLRALLGPSDGSGL